MIEPTEAQAPGSYSHCKIVIFGADGLGIGHAATLRDGGAPGLNALHEPICLHSDGLSVTQPGWATMFSGLPSEHIKCWRNQEYKKMPNGYHLIKKLIETYESRDLYVVWITGKGPNITGFNFETQSKGPHWSVYNKIVNGNHPGIYHGDAPRNNLEVFNLAFSSLSEAITHENFIAFVHFGDPDDTGHATESHDSYMNAAGIVDGYINTLINLLQNGTDVIYCSDHDFHFQELGDAETRHRFAPRGVMATNVVTLSKPEISQMTLGRFIYRRAGGNPDWTLNKYGNPYHLYGVEIF